MNENTNEPKSAVSLRVDEFIRAVDRALGEGGMAAEERQNITADLSVQIEEMLSERASQSGKPVALEDVEVVLAELDPPESYAEAGEAREEQEPVQAGAQASGQAREQEAAEEFGHSCGRGHRRRGHGGFGPGGFGPGGFGRGGRRWFWGKRRVVQAVRQAIHGFSPFGHPAFLGMTERARTAVSLAKSEAQRMGHDFIGTEHLLLGLILEGTGLAAKVLADLGLDREWTRQEAVRLVGPGRAAVQHERLPLTPRMRQAIDEGRLAARKLGHDYLGTEHLLLGLLDVPGVGAQIIANRGLTSQQVRAEVLSRIPNAPPEPAAPAQAAGSSITYWPSSAAQEMKVGENTYKIIAGSGDTGAAYAAVEVIISAADGLGSRTHTREDISVYVLEGSLVLRVEDRTMNLGKGDFARVPRGTAHEIQPGGGAARVMMIATPGGIEKFFGELSRAAEIDGRREVARRFGIGVG
jgi:quercetin dioxygenase-like cupin family protein